MSITFPFQLYSYGFKSQAHWTETRLITIILRKQKGNADTKHEMKNESES